MHVHVTEFFEMYKMFLGILLAELADSVRQCFLNICYEWYPPVVPQRVQILHVWLTKSVLSHLLYLSSVYEYHYPR